jgi:hypothetical protein
VRRTATAPLVPLALAALVACGGESREAPASRAAATTAATRPAPPRASPTCLGTGHWEECTLPDRLERAGLVPIATDSIRRPWLAVAGRTWRLHRATLHVFRYPDSTARARDLATLDTLRAAPRADTTQSWPGPVTLLASDNLLAILEGGDAVLIERVSLALTAGPTPKSAVPGRP